VARRWSMATIVHTGQRARLPHRLVNEVVRRARRYAVNHTSIHCYLMKFVFRGHLMTLVKWHPGKSFLTYTSGLNPSS